MDRGAYALVESTKEEKHALIASTPMREDAHGMFCSHINNGSSDIGVHVDRSNQMLVALNCFVPRREITAALWVVLLLTATTAASPEASNTSPSMATSFPAYSMSALASGLTSPGPAMYGKAPGMIRISTSDLQQRQALEKSIQLAAFQQFDGRKTGILFNVSAPGIPSGSARAIRVRSGSFRRYGVNINEITIPRGCIVDPIPVRVLLVYTRFPNASLFQSVPAGYVLASSVVSVLVYDAGNLNSSQSPTQISVSSTSTPIYIGFPQSNSSKCAYFSNNTTAVDIFDLVQGVCQADHLGTFALVSSAVAPAPVPAPAPGPVEVQTPSSSLKKHSNTWKIIVGSVVGGLALLALVALLAVGIGKRRKDAKLSRMEYQADQGETLQMATIRNTRVPTASNTRTQATLVNDYAV